MIHFLGSYNFLLNIIIMKNIPFFLLITMLSCNSESSVKPVKSYLFDLEKAKVSYKVTGT